jgi:hypothetical protein
MPSKTDPVWIGLCWLPLMAFMTFIIVEDVWKHRDALRKPLYFGVSAFVITCQIVSLAVLAYIAINGMTATLLCLHVIFMFLGGWMWAASVSGLLKREHQRKSKLNLDVSVPINSINPNMLYVMGDDGEIVEVVDDEKPKRDKV